MAVGGSLKGPATIFTQRLRLRPLAESDVAAIHEFKSDPKVTDGYGQDPHRTLAETRSWVEKRIVDGAPLDALFWAITLNGNEKAIGECCLWNFDRAQRCAEVGYELHHSYWGNGLMTEALTAILSHAFYNLHLRRVEAIPLARNVSSQALLQKLGFRQEGVLRQRIFYHSNFEDQHFYGLLNEEWAAGSMRR